MQPQYSVAPNQTAHATAVVAVGLLDGARSKLEVKAELALEGAPVYSLWAVVAHRGRTAADGHYICFARRGDAWLRCDDESRIHSLGRGDDSASPRRGLVVLFFFECDFGWEFRTRKRSPKGTGSLAVPLA